MATEAAAATTALAPRALSALNSTGLPFLELVPEPCTGTKGGTKAVTTAVAPEVGVCGSKRESGSPVDEMPVGVAVTVTSLSTMPKVAQPPRNSVRRCRVSADGRHGGQPA